MLEESCEGFSLFTGLHEGGHLWMHPEVYSYCEGQFTLFEELACVSSSNQKNQFFENQKI